MAVYELDQYRNIVLVGHGGSGKTSLAEALMVKAGVTHRRGSTADQLAASGVAASARPVAGSTADQLAATATAVVATAVFGSTDDQLAPTAMVIGGRAVVGSTADQAAVRGAAGTDEPDGMDGTSAGTLAGAGPGGGWITAREAPATKTCSTVPSGMAAC